MENVIERTVALADGEIIELSDLPPDIAENRAFTTSQATQLPAGGADMPAIIADIERQMITQAISRAEGSKHELRNFSASTAPPWSKKSND